MLIHNPALEQQLQDPSWRPYLEASQECLATAAQLRHAIEIRGISLTEAKRLANVGALG